MKNYLFILILCLSLPGHAQEYSAIKGFVKGAKLKEVTLYKTVDGSIQACATSRIGADGSFGFLLKPETGFYSIGGERLNFPVYLKGGEQVNIDLLETRAQLNGKNSKENKTLYSWVDYATDYYAIIFLHTPREKHPEKSMRPEYYSHIVSARKYTDDKVLQFPEGIKMLISYTSFAYNEDGKKYDVESYTDDCLSYLGNDRLKGEYVVNNSFRSFKSYDQYLNAMEKFGKYLVTPSLKMRAEAVGTKLYDTKAGGQAADFTYPDVDGKMVSLSDFKGKVVLVDVWATWCGPCRQQIPYLKKLEEEMHGTDVVFGGVSVDESKDKQKWLDFIKTEGLKGVQLLAGGWSKITKDYKITGIPRFMVFDKKGNIVSVDAPRPSSPELKKMLENELKK